MTKIVPSIIALVAVIAITITVSAIQDPYPVYGYVTDVLGVPIAGANVTFTNQNTGESICDDTSASGWYMQDAGNFASGYTDGDVIQYQVEYGDCITTTHQHTIDMATGSNTMNITVCNVLDSDHDGVPDAWDEEPNTPENCLTDSCGRGRLLGDMNNDGKLSSVDALMILQMAVR